MEKKIEFIESYIKIGNSDYQYKDQHYLNKNKTIDKQHEMT